MALNPRQKYLSVKHNRVFQLHEQALPTLIFAFNDLKKEVFKTNESEFNQAITDKRIKVLKAKPKPKTAITNNFFINYRIKRELCYLNEGKSNIYEQLIKEGK